MRKYGNVKNTIIKLCTKVIETFNSYDFYNESNVSKRDVMWCLMPLAPEDLMRIPPGHRIRPFVIIASDEYGCEAYSCSSKQPNHKAKMLYECIDKNKYDLDKTSFVDVSKVWHIPYENIKAHYFTLEMDDLNRLINTGVNKCYKSIHNEYGPGCVISRKNKYYVIYGIKKDMYMVHPLLCERNKEGHILKPFALNKKVYYIDMSQKTGIKDIQLFEIVTCLPKMQRKELFKAEEMKNKVLSKRKLNEDFFREISFEFEIGTFFYDILKYEMIIYLYHYKDRAYGVYLNERQGPKYIMRRIKLKDYENKHVICEKELLMDVLHNLSVNEFDYTIIQNILVGLEKLNTSNM